MNFQVPQFIEIEDKIFGPFTFKQFLYLAGSGGAAFIEWVYIPMRFLAILFIVPTVALGLLLAFYKVNNRPFVLTLEAAVKYYIANKLYIWKRSETKAVAPNQTAEQLARGAIKIPKLSGSKLKDLSWSLDVKEKIQ